MRGSVLDLITIAVVFFMFVAGAVIGLAFLEAFQTPFQDVVTDSNARSVISTGVTTFQGMDYSIVFLLFGTFVAVLITAFMIDSHPILFVIALFVLAFVVIFISQLSNVYIQLAQTDILSSAAANYPLTLWIFQNLPTILLSFGILLMIVLYGKSRTAGGIGGV